MVLQSTAQVGIHVSIGIINKMYYIGLFFYAITMIASFFVPAIKEMLAQCFLLAPEISYAMIGIYFYPLAIFICHKLFKQNTPRHYVFLSNQAKLSASVTVSLGLIGTFIGLTGMITAISASLAGDGDVAEKMGAMISSISMALNSMSFAFLTSILGVSISVLLLVSLNFFHFFYQKESKSVKQNKLANEEELNRIQHALTSLQNINIDIANKLVSIPENSDIAKQIAESLSTIATASKENTQLLSAIKHASDDWNLKLTAQLLEDQKCRSADSKQITESLLEVAQTTQWLKTKSLENRKQLLAYLSME